MSFKHYTDLELLDQLGQGNDQVFTEIFDRYWKPMLSVAVNKTGDFDEAEEIVQGVFVSLWKRRRALVVTSGLNHYLAASVKYQVMKVLAERRKRLALEVYEQNIQLTSDDSAHRYLDFEELQSQLSELVSSLPDKCRIVYQLSRETGYSHKEIAAEMGISEKTVEEHIRRALRAIRKGLGYVAFFFTF